MPAAAHADLEVALAAVADRLGHVVRARAAHDRPRPAVDHRVPHRPRLVVSRGCRPRGAGRQPQHASSGRDCPDRRRTAPGRLHQGGRTVARTPSAVGCGDGGSGAPVRPPRGRMGRRAAGGRAARPPGPAAVRLPGAAPRPAGAPRRAGRGALVGGGRRRTAATRCCARRCRGCARRSGPAGSRAAASSRCASPTTPGSTGRSPATGCARSARRATTAGDARAAGSRRARRSRSPSAACCPGFEARWIEPIRGGARRAARRAARDASRWPGVRLGRRRSWPEAEQAARRGVEAAPFRESARAALIEVLRRRGNVAEALVAYDEIRTLLRDELGTTPGRELLALHERLLHAEEPRPTAAPAVAPPPATGCPTGSRRRCRPVGRPRGRARAAARGGGPDGARRAGARCSSPARAASARPGSWPSWPPGSRASTSSTAAATRRSMFPYGPWVEMLRPPRQPRDASWRRSLGDGPDLARLAPRAPRARSRTPAPPRSATRDRAPPAVRRRSSRVVRRLAPSDPLLLVDRRPALGRPLVAAAGAPPGARAAARPRAAGRHLPRHRARPGPSAARA